MKCLYCGKRILAFRLFGGGETFCSEEHGELYRKKEAESAIARILTLDAGGKESGSKKQPLRKTENEPAVAPALAEQTAMQPPPEAGFRLPVVTPYALGREPQPGTVLLPGALMLALVGRGEEALESYLTEAPGSVLAWTPLWSERGGPVAARELAGRCRQPALTSTRPALPVGLLEAYVWRPRSERSAAVTLEPRLASREPLAPVSASPLSAYALGVARPRPAAWLPLADGQAGVKLTDPSIEAGPAVAMPYLSLERFVSRWTAQQFVRAWKPLNAASALPLAVLDRAGDPLVRLPQAISTRRGAMEVAAATPLLRAVSETSGAAFEPRALPERVAFPAPGTPVRPLAATTFVATGWQPCRPWPTVRPQPEPAAELGLWHAWPELRAASLAPGRQQLAAWKPAGWQALPGLLTRNATSLRLVDAPERCSAQLELTVPAATRTAPVATAFADARLWPLPAAKPQAHQAPLAALREPAQALQTPVQHEALAASVNARPQLHSLAPVAYAPPTAAPITVAGPQEVSPALRTVTWSAERSKPGRLLPVATRHLTTEAVAPGMESAKHAVALRWTEAPARQPAFSPAPAAVDSRPAVAALWGTTGDSRTLDQSLAQRKDAPLRLSMEEIPCSLTLNLTPPQGNPPRAPWTLLELTVRNTSREWLTAVPAEPVAALRTPGKPTAPAERGLATRFTPTAWTGRPAAADPVLRRRQLPASRPKMNLPRLRPLAGPLAGWLERPAAAAEPEAALVR